MSDFSSTSHSAARQPVARITGQHGYCIDGDSVRLNADIEWTDRASASSGASAWALQLWARPAFPAANADSIKVAELAIGADGQSLPERVEGWGFALPPAGAEAYTMVLELRAGDGQLHDQVAFARDERFVQPRLSGTGGYRFDGEQVRLEVDRIENPRASDNLSGSLALELWASQEPYRGGEVQGRRVGGAALGRLCGQADWSPVSIDASTQALPAGRWFLDLLLREWTSAGWVTRDYIGFGAPHRVDETAEESALPSSPDSIAIPVPDSALDSSEIPRLVTSALAAAAAAMKDAPTLVLESATATNGKARKTASARTAKAKAAPVAAAAAAPATLSINHASEAELAAIKGLSKAVAKAIVAARPHATVEALLDVKGVGPKLLDKLRARLRA